ncbi:MAG: carboxypeptidase-like regulatory domain-containing protein, partial [Bacteroidota bacterium]
ILFTLALLLALPAWSQNIVRGTITDAANGDALIGASVIISGTTEGTVTDWDGSFEFKTDSPYPFTIEASYVGFSTRTLEVTDNSKMRITLEEDAVLLEGVEVTDTRISDKQKESPLTIEAMDLISIKETPAADFYDGLGSLKGVDLTAASLGFKVVNTRGFNSTSPVRSLQTIDGVDNQAPGLNFSLGNFLGTSELDVVKVELVVGASSAFYGPNAFNGVIAMETKDPFFHQGLSAMVKGGERNMFKTAIRYADAIANKDGNDWFAYKANFEYLRADDWVADNYDPVDESRVPADNPGRFDAVNIYGDEYQSGNDFSDFGLVTNPGLQTWYRTGYREEDLVDYDTRNYKANVAFHFRTKPELQDQSPEILAVTNFGAGTTVYQGDNRFSLRNITFLQNKLEFRKKGEYFIRAYTTRTGAGDSYDPFFTALKMQELAKENAEWTVDYQDYWLRNVEDRIYEAGYPELQVEFDPVTNMVVTSFDTPAAEQFLIDFNDSLTVWHAEAAAAANGKGRGSSLAVPFFEPGTERFDSVFNDITGKLRSEGGTRFFDNSALYHVHGEYKFTPTWIDYITVGANSRLYTPVSRGTVFSDTTDQAITNLEFGFYGGAEKSLFDKKVKVQFAARADKNQNFDWLFSPAGSVVYTPGKNNFFRVSFSSAIRNPTLSDQ